ncbi:hypothetical protein [Halorussus salinisoli]|uniref:hypothetical protein n=1 Tax=Halorussus salinisoli TaxID=2558242 RepID=UPI0010C15ED8|nr:hypothetical protein [Halorussus salinisoli]
MAEAETTVRRERRDESRWLGAAVAGLAGGLVFGLYLQFVVGVLPPRATADGVGSLAFDWAVHLFHSLVFAVVYAELVSWSHLARYADRPATGAAVGAGYGVVLWALATLAIVAFWAVANTVWILPIPGPNLESLVGHVLYGVVLGTVFAVVRRA